METRRAKRKHKEQEKEENDLQSWSHSPLSSFVKDEASPLSSAPCKKSKTSLDLFQGTTSPSKESKPFKELFLSPSSNPLQESQDSSVPTEVPLWLVFKWLQPKEILQKGLICKWWLTEARSSQLWNSFSKERAKALKLEAEDQKKMKEWAANLGWYHLFWDCLFPFRRFFFYYIFPGQDEMYDYILQELTCLETPTLVHWFQALTQQTNTYFKKLDRVPYGFSSLTIDLHKAPVNFNTHEAWFKWLTSTLYLEKGPPIPFGEGFIANTDDDEFDHSYVFFYLDELKDLKQHKRLPGYLRFDGENVTANEEMVRSMSFEGIYI